MNAKIMNIETGEYVADWDGSLEQLCMPEYNSEDFLLVDADNENEVIDPEDYQETKTNDRTSEVNEELEICVK